MKASVKKAEELGARLTIPPTTLPDGDEMAVMLDPQGNEFSDDVSNTMQLRRNRSTRSLWDPNYVDETWINDKVQLVPRIKEAQWLREHGAKALIDISDGLSTDLNHICEESGMGAEIWAKAIPRATIGKNREPVNLKFALHGGDDYELIFTSRSGRSVPSKIAGIPITCIGEITPGRRMSILSETGTRSELKPGGWQHFRHR